ncbi:MAG TPA: hypothetical protein VKW78_19385 [Terriglobales bacterium]|nr:hypothetical protein [Terriglobales bacterium]
MGQYLDQDPIDIILQQVFGVTITGYDGCYGNPVDVTGYYTTWGTNDGSVATAQNAQVTGVGAGSTSSFGQGSTPRYASRGSCPWLQRTASAPTNVVAATLTQQTSGSVSSDNGALAAYNSAEGTTNLGPIIGTGTVGSGCFIGNQVTGSIVPAAYSGTVIIHRWIMNDAEYTNSAQTGSSSNEDDTSSPTYRDDNPQSGGSAGKVYDLDAPGKGDIPADGNVYRYRGNFYAYATLADGTRISPYYNYFVRVSCKNTGSGPQFDNSLPGDNTVQAGTTLTTWNFQ